ncbi:MAG: class A beta-lactamase-related serine hydrolase [Candidatus Bathyarchaeota archaeon]|nr:class A beta-lactamase-related serine hydrolase [Candidatus Bathyarchaeota archaeon]
MTLLYKKLNRRLQEIADDSDAVFGFAVKDLTTGDEIHVNGDEIFPAASTIKVSILLEFFRRVEDLSLNPKEPLVYHTKDKTAGSGVLKMLSEGSVTMPLIDYATLMMTVSDNAATNILIDFLTMDKINMNLEQIGLKVTRLTRKMMDMDAARSGLEFLTTPAEMIQLIESVYLHDKLTQFACEQTLRVMQYPKEGLIQGVIRNSIPDKVPVANKSGWLGGATCDIGLVYQPGRPYAVTVFAKHIPVSDKHMFQAISELTKATELIHGYFEEASSSTTFGRRVF